MQHDSSRFLSQQVGEELVIYDTETNEAHGLNGATALIWQSWSPERTSAELAALLQEKLSLPADDLMVEHIVSELRDRDLLPPVPGAAERHRLSRRQLLVLGGGAVLAAPLISSIVIPTPAAADISIPQPPPGQNGNNGLMGGSQQNGNGLLGTPQQNGTSGTGLQGTP